MAKETKHISCEHCINEYDIEVDVEGYNRWMQGLGYAQDELHENEAWERELLLSATCPECWDRFFPDDEEDCE